jgi:hypothetical protein
MIRGSQGRHGPASGGMALRPKLLLMSLVAALGVLVLGAPAAFAHQCPKGDTSSPRCKETPVYDDWRPNFLPFFDLDDRESERRDAQRWRDECSDDGEERQQCAWVYGGQSGQPYESDPTGTPRPNELHVGYAASHCFLAEGAHDCDTHAGDAKDEFGVHDSHGGAIYADICLSENPDSKRCDDGTADTQAGVTVVDHLDCPIGCFDEYHVVRPLDPEYTGRQADDSAAAAQGIAADPKTHVCGYPGHTLCP